jgi:predicted RND superfamily exporter protein
MSASFEGAVTWAHRRRVLVFSGAAVLLALSVLGLRQISFDANVLRLLPEGGEAVPAFRTFLARFGTLDDLYVVFTAPDGHAIDEYDATIESWVEALRALPELTRVDSGRLEASRQWTYLLDHELLLLDERNLGRALHRLQPEPMEVQLQETRTLLAVPSPEVAAMVRDDPLGFHQLLQEQLGGTSALSFASGADGYVSADARSRLLIARPAQPPYDTEFSHRLFEQLKTVAAAIGPASNDEGDTLPPLEVMYAGGHRIAIEAESVVRRESIVNGIGSLALILPMLFIVFRSAWLVLIGALPSAVALLIVLGMMGLAGVTLSAAATGASAMLFGLGVDGVVLLYVAHRHALSQGHTPAQAIRALGGPAASMLLGMWTTAATFLGLLVVDFPSLEQLGLLIGLSMIVCGVMTLVLVPASLSSRVPRRLPRSLAMPGVAAFVHERRRAILVSALIATLVLGYFATTLRVNFTLDRLRSVTPGAEAVEQVTRSFGLPGDVVVVVAQGSDLQRLLESNEQLTQRLRQQIPNLQFQAPTTLLPAATTQAARLGRIRNAVTDIEAVRTRLEDAAASAGFTPKAFDRFSARLPNLVASNELITWDGYNKAGLTELVGRFVVPHESGWLLATYAFPTQADEIDGMKIAVRETPGAGVLTGVPVVNDELGSGFAPQFAWGLAIGTIVVLLSIVASFKDLRLSLLTLVPTVIGLTWAAGLLGLAQAELDLFSVFAVVTFVGIGVDYGIHLVHRFQDRGDAVIATSELAPVILVAGAITLFGYGTLMMSSYPPLRSIGVVSAVSVVTLVIASVLVLPALLQRKPRV